MPTAILFFSRAAHEEATAKSWLGRRQNRRIAKLLIHSSLKQARASGLPVFIHGSHQQSGNSFGDRIAHAFEAIFAKGFEQLICIGNDALSLSSSDLKASEKALSAGKGWVLGPSLDGGAYLIGMKKSCYQQLDFQALPWQSEGLFSELKATLSPIAKGQELAFRRDLDHAHDLYQEVDNLSHQLEGIRILIRILFEKITLPYSPSLFSLPQAIPLSAGNYRGPPPA